MTHCVRCGSWLEHSAGTGFDAGWVVFQDEVIIGLRFLVLMCRQTLLGGTTTPPAIREILYGAVVLAAVVALRDRVSS